MQRKVGEVGESCEFALFGVSPFCFLCIRLYLTFGVLYWGVRENSKNSKYRVLFLGKTEVQILLKI